MNSASSRPENGFGRGAKPTSLTQLFPSHLGLSSGVRDEPCPLRLPGFFQRTALIIQLSMDWSIKRYSQPYSPIYLRKAAETLKKRGFSTSYRKLIHRPHRPLCQPVNKFLVGYSPAAANHSLCSTGIHLDHCGLRHSMRAIRIPFKFGSKLAMYHCASWRINSGAATGKLPTRNLSSRLIPNSMGSCEW